MRNSYFNLTLFAYPVWISFITRTANTKGSMSGNTAFSINSTRASGARVQAFFSDTCKVIGAFWISSTFWAWSCREKKYRAVFMSLLKFPVPIFKILYCKVFKICSKKPMFYQYLTVTIFKR